METTKLQAILAKKTEKDNKERIEKENQDAQRLAFLTEKANSYLPRIKEWLENANELNKCKIPLYSPLVERDLSSDFRKKYGDCSFCTDGFYHTFGFWQHFDIWRGMLPSQYTTMGIDQGGACGNRDIFTDGTEWWIELEGRLGSRLSMTLKDYENLLYEHKGSNKIDKFGERFEKFLSQL